MKKIISIQQKELSNRTLPYPYYIDKKGFVGRQDFWRGRPYKLIGFAERPIAGYVDLDFVDFWKVPARAVGMYPVFEYKGGKWFTNTIAIASVSFNAEVKK